MRNNPDTLIANVPAPMAAPMYGVTSTPAAGPSQEQPKPTMARTTSQNNEGSSVAPGDVQQNQKDEAEQERKQREVKKNQQQEAERLKEEERKKKEIRQAQQEYEDEQKAQELQRKEKDHWAEEKRKAEEKFKAQEQRRLEEARQNEAAGRAEEDRITKLEQVNARRRSELLQQQQQQQQQQPPYQPPPQQQQQQPQQQPQQQYSQQTGTMKNRQNSGGYKCHYCSESFFYNDDRDVHHLEKHWEDLERQQAASVQRPPANDLYGPLAVDSEIVFGNEVQAIPPPLQRLDAGLMRGIQGNNNSCYIDSSLEVLFLFSNCLDEFLTSTKNTNAMREILRQIITNLRSRIFVKYTDVQRFRTVLDDYLASKGEIKLEERTQDVSDFLRPLFVDILNMPSLLTVNESHANNGEIMLQLFPPEPGWQKKVPPTVQELIDLTPLPVLNSPGLLLLQLPRSGYDSAFQCVVPDGRLRWPKEKTKDLQFKNAESYMLLKLRGVICIETSHYVAFIMADDGGKTSWYFLDGMAQRHNQRNWPEITLCPDEIKKLVRSPDIFVEKIGSRRVQEVQDIHLFTKRLLSTAFVLVYEPE